MFIISSSNLIAQTEFILRSLLRRLSLRLKKYPTACCGWDFLLLEALDTYRHLRI